MKKSYIKKIIQSILTFLLFYFGSYFQLIPIWLFHLDVKHISAQTGIYLTVFSNVVVLLLLVFIFFSDLKKEWKKFRENTLENLDIGFQYWFFGLIGMAISNIVLSILLHSTGATNEKLVQEMISTLPLFMLLSAGILAPIIEEITFRKAFYNIIPNKKAFIIISGLVFGALHVITTFQTPLELLYFIPYSSLGFAFAYMYTKTNTIFTSISMHMFHNLVLTALAILT